MPRLEAIPNRGVPGIQGTIQNQPTVNPSFDLSFIAEALESRGELQTLKSIGSYQSELMIATDRINREEPLENRVFAIQEKTKLLQAKYHQDI